MTAFEIIVAGSGCLIVWSLSRVADAIENVRQEMRRAANRRYDDEGEKVRTAAEEIAALRADLTRASWRLDREERALEPDAWAWMSKIAASSTEEK